MCRTRRFYEVEMPFSGLGAIKPTGRIQTALGYTAVWSVERQPTFRGTHRLHLQPK
jgi:hypothetical protein